jgi:hypothetical protein
VANIAVGDIIVHDTKGVVASVDSWSSGTKGWGFHCNMLSKNQYPPQFYLGPEPKNWRKISNEEYALWKILNE